jgi:hypothetical protein
MAWQTSTYLSDALLNHFFRNTATTPATTLYLALFTSDPARDGSGTEVSGGSYARQAITFDAPSSDSIDQSAEVSFPVASAGWGTVTHWAIFDAVSSGNLYVFNSLDASVTINSGNQATFSAGACTVSNVDPAL